MILFRLVFFLIAFFSSHLCLPQAYSNFHTELKSLFESGEYDSIISIYNNSNFKNHGRKKSHLALYAAKVYSRSQLFDSAEFILNHKVDYHTLTDSMKLFYHYERSINAFQKLRITEGKSEINSIAEVLKIKRTSKYHTFPFEKFLKAILSNLQKDNDPISKFEYLIKNSINSNIEFTEIYFWLIDTLIDYGDLEKAEKYLNQLYLFIKKFPNNKVIYAKTLLLNGYLLHQKAEYTQAIAMYNNKLLKIFDNDISMWITGVRLDYYRISALSYLYLKQNRNALNQYNIFIEEGSIFYGQGYFRIAEAYNKIWAI